MAHLELGQWSDALQAAEQSIAQNAQWAKGYLYKAVAVANVADELLVRSKALQP
jgi:hypothetical protein